MTSQRRIHCEHCGEIIGAYEPMVVVVDGEALQSSRAAVSDETILSRPHYHGACFSQARTRREEPSL